MYSFCLFFDVILEHEEVEFCRTANVASHQTMRRSVFNDRCHIEGDTVHKKVNGKTEKITCMKPAVKKKKYKKKDLHTHSHGALSEFASKKPHNERCLEGVEEHTAIQGDDIKKKKLCGTFYSSPPK